MEDLASKVLQDQADFAMQHPVVAQNGGQAAAITATDDKAAAQLPNCSPLMVRHLVVLLNCCLQCHAISLKLCKLIAGLHTAAAGAWTGLQPPGRAAGLCAGAHGRGEGSAQHAGWGGTRPRAEASRRVKLLDGKATRLLCIGEKHSIHHSRTC